MSSHPIKQDTSESTPLLTNLPPVPIEDDNLMNQDDENLIMEPGTHRHHRPYRFGRYNLKMVLALISILLLSSIVGFFIITGLKIYSNLGNTIQESNEVNITNIEYKGIDDQDKGSINLIVYLDNSIDYNNAENLSDWDRKLLISSSYVIQTLKLNLDDINLRIFDESINEYLELGQIRIDPFDVKIHQNSRNSLQLFVNVKPNQENIFKIVKKMIKNPDEILKLYGDIALKIKFGLLNIPMGKIRIDFTRNFKLYDFIGFVNAKDFNFNNFEISKEDNIVSVKTFLDSKRNKETDGDDLLSKYRNHISIPDILYWDLYLRSPCTKKIDEVLEIPEIKLATLKTSNLSKFLNSKEPINLESLLNNLPSVFFESCDSEDEFSPLSNIIRKLVYDKDESIMLDLRSSSENEKELPTWLYENIFASLNLEFDLKSLTSLFLKQIINDQEATLSYQFLKNTTLENLSFSVDNGFDKPTVSGDLIFNINIPSFVTNITEFNIDVEKLKGLGNLSYKLKKFGYIDVHKWLKCEDTLFEDEHILNLNCSLEQNQIIITNGESFSKLINDYLLGADDIKIEIDCIFDLLMKFKELYENEFIINRLRGSGNGYI
ncbi:hypothetical protein PACTADRAFT_48331 [Pachysolen tannophilus NRRL Y-2460]|uniref:Uncharacterized protein n=1 Tax=Pachysolen tannophilus NRRL Y-2460 TaxID=669874 RepID=A0A1E4U3N6_PACTA|nr:hypothetical protein PACTADRAFT_48331 [Pachysolen tannophilus NRRL Y-2460]